MFEATRVLLYYGVSPLHAGAGTAVGELIDNPIQRERHTRHPVVAGSGIKGALRHGFQRLLGEETNSLFGPPGDAELRHAGAVSFSDAQMVLFPVRSLEEGFVWVSSPVTLGRLARMFQLAGIPVDWKVPSLEATDDLIAAGPGEAGRTVIVDAFEIQVQADAGVEHIATQLTQWLFDDADDVFAAHLRRNLLVVPESLFGHFVEYATVVEPHVRINDETGTADDGGLFYTENLPPESVLAGLMLASAERTHGGRDAEAVAARLTGLFDREVVQIGGDATTGRGLMRLRVLGPQGGVR